MLQGHYMNNQCFDQFIIPTFILHLKAISSHGVSHGKNLQYFKQKTSFKPIRLLFELTEDRSDFNINHFGNFMSPSICVQLYSELLDVFQL